MNCTVRFLPAEVTIAVPEGTTISEATRCAELTTLHLPCGGRGTCGKCLVQLFIGDAPSRLVLACKTAIDRDCTINLPAAIEHSGSSIVADASIDHIDASSEDFSPVCRAVSVAVPEPEAGVNLADLQRLEAAIRKAGDQCTISCCRKIMRQLSDTVRREAGFVTAVITETGPLCELSAIRPGTVLPPTFGIACDIGTTTIALHLVDLVSGNIIASATDYNSQLSRGSDIISRIDYARTPERLEELSDLVLNTINGLIGEVLVTANIMEESVYAMVIAGNCTMIHLLLGLKPEYIREAPYVPTVNHVPIMRAADCSLLINPEAVIMFAPGVGSYVGGDITSGLLCTDLIDTADTITLFIDIGTNGEIVIGNSEFLLTCACSAGPAFEGSGIRSGMRAGKGAIDSFSIDPTHGAIEYTVIGNGLPGGVCGSGLISLLGELLTAGYIDRSGKFTDAMDPARKVAIDGTTGLILVDAAAADHGKDIIITENDIDNLIRTKGAIYAACDLLLKNAGLDFQSIGRVLIAGGFGKYIDVDAAIRIGLFPDIDRSRFSYLGNTALAGATRALLSKKYRDILRELPGKMTYVDLSAEPGYMDAYTAALFLPHTELERFASQMRNEE